MSQALADVVELVSGEWTTRRSPPPSRPSPADDHVPVALVGVDENAASSSQSSALSVPRADAAALAAWTVDRSETGAIVVAGVELHPAIARDLYQRLGAHLELADRDEMHAEWARLEAWLDAMFVGATPVSGRTVGRPSQAVAGLALRERDDQVAVRLATYVVAFARPSRGRWEGAAWQLRPSVTGHERRPMGVRVRFEAVPDARPERRHLVGPTQADAPRRGLGRPPRPHLPEWLRQRRDTAMAEQQLLRDAMDAPRSLDELVEATRLPRATVRAHLEVLVERREARRVRGSGATRWRRLEAHATPAPVPAGAEAPTTPPPAPVGAPGTRLGPAPKGKLAGPTKGTKRASAPPAPAAPRPELRSCWTCNTSCHTNQPACPRCRTPY